MKRISVLALSLILALSLLAVPSYAAESPVHSTVDLMQAVSYDLYRNGTFSKSFFGSTSEAWLNNSNSAAWVWSSPHTDKFDSMVVTIAARVQPSTFVYYDSSGNNRSGTLVGKKSAGVVTYFQYSFGSSTAAAGFKFEATWSSNYTGEFMIVSAFGNLENTVSFSNVSYFGNAILYDNGGGEYTPPEGDDFRFPLSVTSVNNGSFPAVVSFTGPTGSQFYSLDYGEVFLKVNFDNTFKYFDQVTFLIYSSGQISSTGARIEYPDGSVVDGLDIQIEYCGETQYVFELEEEFHRKHCYLVTVDTKGYDLTGKVISLQSCIDSVLGSFIYEYDRGFYFECTSAVGKFNVNDIPWYAHFGLWLDKVLSENNNSVISALSEGFSYVSEFTWNQLTNMQQFLVTKFTDLSTTISNGFSYVSEFTWDQLTNMKQFLVTKFTDLSTTISNGFSYVSEFTWLQVDVLKDFFTSKFNNLFSILNSSGDNQQFEDDVGQQGDKLDDMEQVMDSVTKPALDSIDTDLSDIVSDADLTNVAQVYTFVMGDCFLPQVMTMIVVMAMMSFVLFGKR